MAEIKVELKKIKEIIPHSNADRLELVIIDGWQCVIQKGQFKPQDEVLFIPIDTILPDELIEYFNLTFVQKNRVRAVKLRQEPSYGICLSKEKAGEYLKESLKLNIDYKDKLKITKYEPPLKQIVHYGKKNKFKTRLKNFKYKIFKRRIRSKRFDFVFNKYTEIENLRNYMSVFNDDDIVVVHEKIHGMNARFGKMIGFNENLSLFKTLFGNLSKPIYFVGSHNVEKNISGGDEWSKFFNQNKNIKELLDYVYDNYETKQVILFGELYGKGVQDLEYSLNDVEFVAFDIMVDGKYLDKDLSMELCHDFNIKFAPLLYSGKYSFDMIKRLEGKSSIDNKTIREGVVITSDKESLCKVGRKILKYVFDQYLTRDNGTEAKE